MDLDPCSNSATSPISTLFSTLPLINNLHDMHGTSSWIAKQKFRNEFKRVAITKSPIIFSAHIFG
jgi:hypothetical protein